MTYKNHMKSMGKCSIRIRHHGYRIQQHTKLLSTKKRTWNHSMRPEEQLYKKQSIIYIKRHTYILGLLKVFKNLFF